MYTSITYVRTIEGDTVGGIVGSKVGLVVVVGAIEGAVVLVLGGDK